MPRFTKLIDTEVGLLEFSFTSIHSKYGLRYYINVTDSSQKYYFFSMSEKGGSWQIENAIKLPGWLQKLKGKLSMNIIENEP
jgi:hypothetical protein